MGLRLKFAKGFESADLVRKFSQITWKSFFSLHHAHVAQRTQNTEKLKDAISETFLVSLNIYGLELVSFQHKVVERRSQYLFQGLARFYFDYLEFTVLES